MNTFKLFIEIAFLIGFACLALMGILWVINQVVTPFTTPVILALALLGCLKLSIDVFEWLFGERK